MAKLTARLVELARERFKAGDPAALLDAVDSCARAGMPMPPWLAEAFCERYARWARFEKESATLDAAFNVKRPKKMHIGKRELREWLRPRVVFAVLRLHRDGGAPIDQQLFDIVGEEFNISGGQASKIYYEPASALLRKLGETAEKLYDPEKLRP
jgi:hypothetical protein